MKGRQKLYYDKSAKDLPILDQGDIVGVKPYKVGDKQWQKAVVKEKLTRRSYLVTTGNGRTLRRVQLRKSNEATVEGNEVAIDKPQTPAKPVAPDIQNTAPSPTAGSPVKVKPYTTHSGGMVKPPRRCDDYV